MYTMLQGYLYAVLNAWILTELFFRKGMTPRKTMASEISERTYLEII